MKRIIISIIAALFIVALLFVFVGPYKYVHIPDEDAARFENSGHLHVKHCYHPPLEESQLEYRFPNAEVFAVKVKGADYVYSTAEDTEIAALFYKINRLTGKTYILYADGYEEPLLIAR